MRDVSTYGTRPVWAEVSAAKLKANYRATQAAAGDAINLLAVIKADAYGHGAVECAPVFRDAGARWLGVTSVEEGVAVRGVLQESDTRILVMCSLWQGEAEACLAHNLTPVVWEPYQLKLLLDEAKRRTYPLESIKVHVEIDTGMSRQGVTPGAELDAFLNHFRTPPLQMEGVMSHLASAEEVEGQQNDDQRRAFFDAVSQIHRIHPALLHVGNTPAVDGKVIQGWLPELARQHAAQAMTRAGLALYGYTLPLSAGQHHVQVSPAMTWKTRIVSLREIAAGTSVGYSATFTATRGMKLALLPVGYADGFRRELSSRGAVLIRGQRAPIVGRVSMDLTIVDVTHIADASIHDEAVLLGTQGSETIGAHEHAALAETIPYEILCGISDRVPRVIVD